jgi:hypothetical protein
MLKHRYPDVRSVGLGRDAHRPTSLASTGSRSRGGEDGRKREDATVQGGKYEGRDDREPDGDKRREMANRKSGKDTSVQGSGHTNGIKWENGACEWEEDTTPA